MDNKYKLQVEITPIQAHTILRALELLMRTGLGQMEYVASEINELHKKDFPWHEDDNPTLKLLNKVKKEVLGFHSCSNLGITNQKVHEDCKIAYDLWKVIEKPIAVEEKHHGWSVSHDGPILHEGKEPIATVSVLKNNESYFFINSHEIKKAKIIIDMRDGTGEEIPPHHVQCILSSGYTLKGKWLEDKLYILEATNFWKEKKDDAI